MATELTGRQRRKFRIRNKISGSDQRPRLSVFRTATHIYAQVVVDADGRTLAAASTLDKELKGKLKSGGDKEAAKQVGLLIAARAKEAGIEAVVLDRGGYLYHGRVKALADGAREGGLQF